MRFNSTNSSSGILGPDNITPLPNYLRQAIIGILLGDGTLVKKYKGGGTYFKFAQGANHYSYLVYVFQLFSKSGLCNMIEPSKGSTINSKTGLTYDYFYFFN